MKARQVMEQVQKVILGKDDVIEQVWMAMLAGGHILLEDIPGVGKTTLALAFSKTLNMDFKRIQFTPDVVASDVVGFTLYDTHEKKFVYQPGVAMTNILLADELNRTSSRTQSALLETMEERQISVDGKTYALPEPFIVIATQNPFGSYGTQRLPSSQLDRFMVQLSLGYPAIEAQISLLEERMRGNPLDDVEIIYTQEELIEVKKEVEAVEVSREVLHYLSRLCEATRHHESIAQGISPRGSIMSARMAKARAFLLGRDYVIPEDVLDIFIISNHHRILLDYRQMTSPKSPTELLQEMIQEVPAPHER